MKKLKRAIYAAVSLLLIGPIVLLVTSSGVMAAQITGRSLTLVGGTTTGGSEAGAVVNHLFTFTVPTTATVGSIGFLYCTTADGTCTTPAGLLTTSATLATQSGATGFTIVNTTNGDPYIAQSSTPTSVTGGTQLIYQLDGITNPTTSNLTFYVRIATYASTTATGIPIDTGNVAASTANQILLTGQMPESLVFCVGGTISETSGVPNCTTATSGAVSFTTLFSPTAAATATSQMAASTNASHGYAITINGATLQSGSNQITPMATATTSINGISQFGVNLVANTTATSTPAVGSAITPASNGTSYEGQPLTGYSTPDTFQYVTGATIANSGQNSSSTPSGTDAQIYTTSYIVNVPGNQPAGTYTTTLTYICTPTF